MRYEVVVIGVSAGGLTALSTILPALSYEVALPILVVQHVADDSSSFLAEHLSQLCKLTVKIAEDKMLLANSIIYIAPPGYHLLVENKTMLALSRDEKVNFSRPSIDVLFESAADVFRDKILAIILTGANYDGVQGAKKIKNYHGTVLVQSLESSEAKCMPAETIKQVQVDKILDLKEIGPYLNKILVRGTDQ